MKIYIQYRVSLRSKGIAEEALTGSIPVCDDGDFGLPEILKGLINESPTIFGRDLIG